MADSLSPSLGADGRIVEGIITTLNADQTANISPLGPIVGPLFETFVLRPFRTSTTYHNLKRTGQGVFHVTDDVNLFAQAALGTPEPLPEMTPASKVNGKILTGACRWYALKVSQLDDSTERTQIVAQCVDQGRQRDFLGYNRAQHAVLEAAILATRMHLLRGPDILAELDRLESPVAKTASNVERRAFSFLRDHIQSRCVSGENT